MPLINVRDFLLIVIAVCHVQEDADLERRKKKAFIQNNNLENLRKNITDRENEGEVLVIRHSHICIIIFE